MSTNLCTVKHVVMYIFGIISSTIPETSTRKFQQPYEYNTEVIKD